MLFRHRGAIPGGPRLLSEDSIELLIADQIPDRDNLAYGCNGMGWSLGFFVIRAPGCSEAPGLRPGTIAHTGRFATDFWYDPEQDQIGIILYQIVTNDDSTPSLAERDAFKQMLVRITEAR